MEVTKILWGKGAENREEIPRIIYMDVLGRKKVYFSGTLYPKNKENPPRI